VASGASVANGVRQSDSTWTAGCSRPVSCPMGRCL